MCTSCPSLRASRVLLYTDHSKQSVQSSSCPYATVPNSIVVRINSTSPRQSVMLLCFMKLLSAVTYGFTEQKPRLNCLRFRQCVNLLLIIGYSWHGEPSMHIFHSLLKHLCARHPDDFPLALECMHIVKWIVHDVRTLHFS